MCSHQITDQPGKIAKPAHGQLSRCSRSPENLVSRDRFGGPTCASLLILHTQAEFGAYSRDSSSFPRRRPFFVYRHTPSGQSGVYQVAQLSADDVHFRESVGTGPVVLMVVSFY